MCFCHLRAMLASFLQKTETLLSEISRCAKFAGAPADLGEDGVGYCVGRVLLVGVVLDDHAAVHEGAVVRVELLRMVGVHAVRVVGGDHEALRDSGAALAVACVEGGGCAGEHVGEERGIRALLAAAADLLVVENGADVDVLRVLCGQESGERGVRAFEVVDARAGEDLAVLDR